jgi:hypothetical protein
MALVSLLLLTVLTLATIARASASGRVSIWATPHEQFSSSAGVLGCKVDNNRIAYWPGQVDCNNICVSVSYAGRSLTLLHVDTSEGAYDISYDAWNYLYTGYSAEDQPVSGGPVPMDYEYLHPSECADLIHTEGGGLPLSAPTAMNFLTSCMAQPDSWVAQNHVLYNIIDAICSWGFDEECTLEPPANQATCPHTLGLLESLPSSVYNIRYGTGERVSASTGEVVEGSSGRNRQDIAFACLGAILSLSAGMMSPVLGILL